MQRDNELIVDGHRVLRFPAFVVRDSPELVAMLIGRALRQPGDAEQELATRSAFPDNRSN